MQTVKLLEDSAHFIRHLCSSFARDGHEIILLLNSSGPFEQEMPKTYEVHCLGQGTVVGTGFNIGPLRLPHIGTATKNLLSIHRNRTRVTNIIRTARRMLSLDQELRVQPYWENLVTNLVFRLLLAFTV